MRTTGSIVSVPLVYAMLCVVDAAPEGTMVYLPTLILISSRIENVSSCVRSDVVPPK